MILLYLLVDDIFVERILVGCICWKFWFDCGWGVFEWLLIFEKFFMGVL